MVLIPVACDSREDTVLELLLPSIPALLHVNSLRLRICPPRMALALPVRPLPGARKSPPQTTSPS
jgi:hypothetical protein